MRISFDMAKPLTVLCALTLGLPLCSAQVTVSRSSRTSVTVRRSGSYLGVGVISVNAEIAQALGLREVRGVQVTDVVEDGPASRAGLKQDDVLLDYNGQRIEGTSQFVRMVAETTADQSVPVGVFRNRNIITVNVRVEQRTGNSVSITLPPIPIPPMPPMPPIPSVTVDSMMLDIPIGLLNWQNASFGYTGEALDGQLAEYFGVKEGVLIRFVTKQGPADRAGLRAGDVIVRVDASAVRNPREITALARRQRREKKPFSFTVIRGRKELTFEVIAARRDRVDSSPATV